MPGGGDVEALEFLRRAEPFRDLDASSLENLAESATIETVQARDVLLAEGDPAGDAYVVVTGKLEVHVGDAAGRQVIVAELGPGDVVGEMALLTGAPRSATVRARRDSVVVRLARAHCMRIAQDEPQFIIDLARNLVARLDRSIHQIEPTRSRSVIAIVPAGAGADHRRFLDNFADVLRRSLSVAVVGPERSPGSVGVDESSRQMAMFLQRTELTNDLTLLLADGADDEWTRLCVRQADSILLVGTATGLTHWSKAERALEEIEPEGVDVQRHLVILHDATSPSDTRWLLHQRTVDRHHHIRLGEEADLSRLARILTDTSVGLVLSGGGARGFAHFGVIKALVEAGVPIDHVGGTSIGASIAGVYAARWDWETMLAKERYATIGQGNMVDISLPLIALGRGERLTKGIREGFGDLDIADLWLEFFSVSTDLTSGRSRVHTLGPVWRAVRASVAIPGVLPPVRDEDGHVLVDGGVLNNLPVDVMRTTFAPTTVIAVDVRGSLTLQSFDLPDDGVVSGWRVAANRLSPRQRTLELPGIVELLSAASSVHGSDQAEHADRLLAPPLQTFGVLDFAANERIIDIGYRHACEAIDTWERLPGL